MSIDEIDYWNDYLTDKLKNKNQPILHLYNTIEKEFPNFGYTIYNMGFNLYDFFLWDFFIFLFGSRQAFLKVGTLTSLWFLPVLFLARILLEGLFHITHKLKWNLNIVTIIFMFKFSVLFSFGFSLTKFREEFILMCEGRYFLFFIINALTGSFAVLVFSILADRFIGENRFIKYVTK